MPIVKSPLLTVSISPLFAEGEHYNVKSGIPVIEKLPRTIPVNLCR